MFSILEAAVVPQPDIFNSYEDLFANLDQKTRKQGYKIVKARSQRSRIGGADVPDNQIVRCDLVCSRGGRPYKSVAKTHKTTTRKTNCPWRAKAVYRKNVSGWTLTVHCNEHNHEPDLSETQSPTSPTLDAEPMNISDHDISPSPPPPSTAAAMQLEMEEEPSVLQMAGLSDESLPLNGNTFDQLREEYSKVGSDDRNKLLAGLQLRIAALYAVQRDEAQANARRGDHTEDRMRQNLDSHNTLQMAERKFQRRRSRHGPTHVSNRDEEAEQLQHLRRSNEASLEDPLASSPFTMIDAMARPLHGGT